MKSPWPRRWPTRRSAGQRRAARNTCRPRALYAHVLAALAQSDFETAYRHAIKISPAGQLAAHEPHALWVMLDLVEAALRTDRAGEAAAHVRAMQEAGVALISSRLALLAGAAAAMIAPDEEASRAVRPGAGGQRTPSGGRSTWRGCSCCTASVCGAPAR